jgi:hypothetical protein
MVLIYLKEGECVELPTAVSVGRRNGSLICYDHQGREVASYSAMEVESFTNNTAMAELIKDEVCEDLTVVVPPGEPQQEGQQSPA